MKKIVACIFMSCMLVFLCGVEEIAAACKSANGYSYCAINVGNASVTKPIYNSQVYHSGKNGTSVNVTKSVSNTVSASASLNWGASVWGTTLSASVGVSVSDTQTTNTSIGFVLSSANSAGYYRVDAVFPGYSVRFTQAKTPEYVIVASRVVGYAPIKNRRYHKLTRYA